MFWSTRCVLSGGDGLVDQMWVVSKKYSGRPDEGCQGDIVWLTDVKSFKF